MNKLRKPSSTSMTMQYARSPHKNSSSPSKATTTTVPSSRESDEQERQHWIARALRAEALLSAHAIHREEVKSLGHHQEATRQRELLLVSKEYKERHEALERLVVFLLVLIAILVILVVYLATFYVVQPQQKHYPSTWWPSALGPSHFTIPILSPFTSVVEHESSVIGPRSVGTLAVISACLIYLIFRYWITSRPSRSKFATTTSISSSAGNAARALLSTTSNAIDR